MAWSKLEESFREHRKLKRMAVALGIRRSEARGLMAGLWSWATTQAPDGNLSDHTAAEVEEGMDWEGAPGDAIGAAIKEKLIDETGAGWELHKWMPRAGSFRKAIQKQKERKEKQALRDAALQSRDCSPPARKVSQARREEKRRNEKRRDEKTTAPPAKKRATPESPTVQMIPTTRGNHPVTELDVKGWAESYPAVSIEQALRSMREWCLSNPTKIKTPRGVRRFITGWLDREQNKGGSPGQSRQVEQSPSEAGKEWVRERQRIRDENG